MSTHAIHLLGPLRVEWETGDPPRFRSQRTLALLGYLAAEQRPISREALSALFWPEQSEPDGKANLRRELHNLVSVLPGCWKADRATVAFAPGAQTRVDIYRLLQLEAAEAWVAAAELVRGDFLEGLYLEDHLEFEAWLLGERERWRQRAERVLRRAVDERRQAGDAAGALRLARRLLQLMPWHEQMHREVMVLLARQGQRTAALRQYELCKEMLWEELGVEPSAVTEALYHRIADSTPFSRHNIPAATTPFIGRKQELARLNRWLEKDDVRLISITGAGGMGKTRLALALARSLVGGPLPPFTDGVWFISLASLDHPAQLVSEVAGVLDLSFEGTDRRSPRHQLLDYLARKQMLLSLDNFEHLLSGAELITSLLQAAPGVKVVVTSREPLHLQGEHLLALQGLDHQTKEQDGPTDAAALFLSAARRLQPELRLAGEEEQVQLNRICDLVEGMPLALELAASWSDSLSLAAIGDEIESNLGFLQAELQDVPTRHQSVRAVFDASWQRLSSREQRAFAAFSVFRGGFRSEAAQVVADAELSCLANLVRKSLVQYERADARYRLHSLLQQYAAHKLAQDPPLRLQARDRHLRYFLELAETCDAAYRRTKQPEWLNRIAEEHDNLRAALQWASHQEEVELVGRISGALGIFWGIRGHLQEGRGWLERALTHRLELSAHTVGKVLFALGWLAFEQGDYPSANNYYQASFQLVQSLGDTELTAELLSCLGHVAQQQAEYGRAERFCEQSLLRYRQLDDAGGVALILNRLGRLAELRGDYPRAVELLEESLALRKACGDERGTASSLNGLAEIARFRGHYRRAAALYEEALATCRRLDDKRCVAGIQHNIAHVARHLKEYAKAEALFTDSMILYSELENVEGIALCLAGLGGVLVARGGLEKAVHLLAKADALFRSNSTVLSPADELAYERSLAAVRRQLSEAEFDSAWAHGQRFLLDEIRRYASG